MSVRLESIIDFGLVLILIGFSTPWHYFKFYYILYDISLYIHFILIKGKIIMALFFFINFFSFSKLKISVSEKRLFIKLHNNSP